MSREQLKFYFVAHINTYINHASFCCLALKRGLSFSTISLICREFLVKKENNNNKTNECTVSAHTYQAIPNASTIKN